MELSGGSFEAYAIWMGAWIALWTVVAIVWLHVYWIRRAIRAYREMSPAERLLAQARHWREQARPKVRHWQRKWRRQWRDWKKSF